MRLCQPYCSIVPRCQCRIASLLTMSGSADALMLQCCCRYIMQTYARPELVFTHGEGARLYDAHGKEYLDFAAGIAVNALGA